MTCGCSPLGPNAGPAPVAGPALAAMPLAGLAAPAFSPIPLLPNTTPPLVAQEQANVGAIGPAATVTFTTTAIQPLRSGRYYVIGVLGATASGVSTQTGTMRLDVAGADTVIAVGTTGTGGAGPFNMTFIAFVTVTKNATHTFSVRAVASAGTNTIAAGGFAKIVLIEIPN